jgi:hypothetical protein
MMLRYLCNEKNGPEYDFFGGTMIASFAFYLCPTCFYACESPAKEHEHALLRVDPGLPGDEKRKPVTDRNGRILSAAPRWFYEAIREVKSDP